MTLLAMRARPNNIGVPNTDQHTGPLGQSGVNPNELIDRITGRAAGLISKMLLNPLHRQATAMCGHRHY